MSNGQFFLKFLFLFSARRSLNFGQRDRKLIIQPLQLIIVRPTFLVLS